MEKSKEYNTAAILSYITILGWVIAIIFYRKDKTELAAYHLKQALGLHLTFLLFFFLFDTVGRIMSLLIVIFIIIGLIYAIQGDRKPVPVVGDLFQSLFKGIG